VVGAQERLDEILNYDEKYAIESDTVVDVQDGWVIVTPIEGAVEPCEHPLDAREARVLAARLLRAANHLELEEQT
jgi:hypothetical protein